MRITLAGLKGGVGKTTSAVWLSECAAREGRTLLVDADDQRSATRWNEAAPEGLSADVVGLATTTIARDLRQLAEGYAHVIIDTPPKELAISRGAMAAAELVVVPIGGSLVELDRLRPTLQLAQEADRPIVALLTRQRRTKLAAEIDQALIDAAVPTLQTAIPLRVVYEQAFGTRPTDLSPYDEVWAELITIAKALP